MKRIIIASLLVSSCSNVPTGPSVLPELQPAHFQHALAPTGNPLNSCQDSAPIWFTKNSSVDSNFTAELYPSYTAKAYIFQVMFNNEHVAESRQGESWFKLDPTKGAGRYTIVASYINACDRRSAMSESLTVYIEGGDNDRVGQLNSCLYCHNPIPRRRD